VQIRVAQIDRGASGQISEPLIRASNSGRIFKQALTIFV